MAADGRIILGSPFPLMGKGRDRGAREPIKAITPTFVLPRRRLCPNATNHLDVMLSESEASAFPTGYEKADSSTVPQNDIMTQSLEGRENRLEGALIIQLVFGFDYLSQCRQRS
jgi:hypothetical protein